MEKADKSQRNIKQTVKSKTKNEFLGFFEFVRSHGVVGIAIGFIVGTQSRLLVDQLTASFVNPILGLIVGSSEGLSQQRFFLTVNGNTAEFAWGAFVYSLINFIVIAAIIYFAFKWLKLEKLDKKA